MEVLAARPEIRDYLDVGERVAAETGMIKSAAGAASFLVAQANPGVDLTEWFEGVADGAGLAKSDPRLLFRKLMFSMVREQAGQVLRRRDTREHVALFHAFNAWAAGESGVKLRYVPREPVPAITNMS